MSVDASREISSAQESALRLELESWERWHAAVATPGAVESPAGTQVPVGGPAAVRRRQRAHIWLMSLTDTLAVGIAVTAALTYSPARYYAPAGEQIAVPVVIGLLWVALLSLGEPRAVRRARTGIQQTHRVLRVSGALFGSVAGFAVLTGWEAGKWHLLVTLPVGTLLILIFRRMVLRHQARRRRRNGHDTRRALLLGTGSSTQEWDLALQEQGRASGYQVAGVFNNPGMCGCGTLQGAEDRVSAAVDAATRAGVDTVILTDSAGLSSLAMRELGWRLAALDISLLMGGSLHEVAPGRLWIESLGGLPVIHVEYPRLRGIAAVTKRCFDVVFSLAALVVVVPVVAAAALAVAVESRGPVLFRQKRVGLDHQQFSMFKVRSMTHDAEDQKAQLQECSEGNEVLFKIREDPRVTRVGRIIRRFSIDELPQFFNVLTGDMSVVGPRPPLPAETETYDDRADRRMTVKPGITGPWQIGGRSDLTWEQSLRLDTYYVENWSVTGDLLIVIKTVRAVFRGSGAY